MKLSFLGFGAGGKKTVRFFGNNSAMLKNKNPDGTENMLLLDCGPSAIDTIDEHNILHNVGRLVCFLSHTHFDHLSGYHRLVNRCGNAGVKLYLLKTCFDRHDHDIESVLMKGLNVKRKDMEPISADEAADIFNLKSMEFELLNHTREVQTAALILNEKPAASQKLAKTVFAPDHNDIAFVLSVIKDRELEDFYTDCTANPPELENNAHFPFETLKQMVCTDELRARTTPMHLNSLDLLTEIDSAGFNNVSNLRYYRNCAEKDAR